MSATLNPVPATGYVANPVFNALVPAEGPKVVTIAFDFSQARTFNVDFQELIQSGKLACVASVFVDNSQNTNEILLTVQGTAQPLKIPPNSQGTFPIYALKIARFTIYSASTTALATMLFSNSTQPLAVWGGLS